jgi:hypothetical protein
MPAISSSNPKNINELILGLRQRGVTGMHQRYIRDQDAYALDFRYTKKDTLEQEWHTVLAMDADGVLEAAMDFVIENGPPFPPEPNPNLVIC